jgi:prepilin-type N-terminal cleavage/methylation domain-containing protein
MSKRRLKSNKRLTYSHQGGFTLFELIVTLAFVAILGSFASPHFSTLHVTFDRMNAQSFLIQDLKRAQAEAITLGCRGILSINNYNTGYSFGCDFLPYDDASPPKSDVVSFARNLPVGLKIYSDAPIIFNSRGQAVDVEGNMSNISIQLTDLKADLGSSVFAAGTLLGTGVFSYDT